MRNTQPRSIRRLSILVAAVAWLAVGASAPAGTPDPIVYTVRVLPDAHAAEVQATIPTGGKPFVDLMMAVWSPGFYRVENYASRVQEVAARTPDGAALTIERPQQNRWRVATNRARAVVVFYRIACAEGSVTTNLVSASLAVLNGAPTFVTLVEKASRPHDVRLELPPSLPRAMTSLDAAPDGQPNHYRAADYDTLVDSPIVAGDLDVHEFQVDGRPHYLVDAGDRGQFDGAKASADLRKIVGQARQFWGFLPYRQYVFLNVFRQGGGGLEHKDSTLLTASAARATTEDGYHRWLSFVAHEYFHAFNVKRLRPVELGPFDYEHEPRTKSLWISEGFTSYFGEILLARAGIDRTPGFLAAISSPIRQLQQAPGRLVQTLEQSSWDIWTNSMSGINTNAQTSVSYYVKGEVAGLLLDARIRHATAGAKSLDDVMRLAYQRYAGARGFTPEEFRKAAEEVARVDLGEWFRRTVASTEELDYDEMLEWFGLRFAARDGADAAANWKLEVREDATAAQIAHLQALLGGVRASTGSARTGLFPFALSLSKGEPYFAAKISLTSTSRRSLSTPRVASTLPAVTSVLNDTR